ncbi:MAG TPA: hypothetical protein VF698_12065 [Thermoanaerobaculia bacterium]|jgi:hypothetical protein
MLNGLVLLLALASGVNERALREVQPVEHWTVKGGGYAVTFYPGFATRVTIGGTELYRQVGSYDVGTNAPSGRHLIRVAGGDLRNPVTLSIDDPGHQIARLKVNFYGEKSLVIDDTVVYCPPFCIDGGGAAAKIDERQMLVPTSFHGAPEVTVRAHDYDVSLYPGFASSVKSTVNGRTSELYRQRAPYRLPEGATATAGRHEVRIAGGPYGRNLTIGMEDDTHQIASIEADLHGPGGGANETITIYDDVITCPPVCK